MQKNAATSTTTAEAATMPMIVGVKMLAGEEAPGATTLQLSPQLKEPFTAHRPELGANPTRCCALSNTMAYLRRMLQK